MVTDKHMSKLILFFLHACGLSALRESLKKKLFFPKQLVAFNCPFCSAGAVNFIYVSVADLPFLDELNAAILAAFCNLVYLVASRLGLSILF